MKNSKKIIIGVFVLLTLIFIGRRISRASDMAPPAGDPTKPVPDQLPNGSILPKMVSEDCEKKYGKSWQKFTATLCKKV